MGTKPGQLTNSSQGQLKIWPLRHQHCKETQGLLSSWSSGRISKDPGKQRPDRTDTGWRRCRLPERDLQSLGTQLHLLGRERGEGEGGSRRHSGVSQHRRSLHQPGREPPGCHQAGQLGCTEGQPGPRSPHTCQGAGRRHQTNSVQ